MYSVLAILLEAVVTSWDGVKAYFGRLTEVIEHEEEIIAFINKIDDVMMEVDEFREKVEGWANGG